MEIKSFKHLNIDSETVRDLIRNYINELMNNGELDKLDGYELFDINISSSGVIAFFGEILMTRLEEIALEFCKNNKIRNGTYIKDKELFKEAQSIQINGRASEKGVQWGYRF